MVNKTAKNKIRSLKREISKEIDVKHQNKIFEAYFDEANEKLFKQLKERFPDLTPYDLRLCAFIRMNISTKEIAAILNISYRGAEVSRYRLRKKLKLSRGESLSAFIAGF
jgi:DNA-binding CsgD family transcriptional regulator